MRNLLLLFLLALAGIRSNAQDSTVLSMMLLSEKEEYKSIIEKYAALRNELNARALYYLGQAYFMTDQDSVCVVVLDMSIAKNGNDAEPHYTRAASLAYQNKYELAVEGFKKAIQLNPERALSHVSLSDALYNLQRLEEARKASLVAIEKDSSLYRPYVLIANSYMDEDDQKKGLEWYYKAYAKADRNTDIKNELLYNLGLLEYLVGDNKKAQQHLELLIKNVPGDFRGYAKLIQTYYKSGTIEKAEPLRKKLYEAHEKEQLPETMKKAFCFDQFVWKDRNVQVYERFQSGASNRIYYKHVFYVLDKQGEIDFTIQTEYSPASVSMGGHTYLLGMSKGTYHATYSVGFKEDVDYATIKEQVIKVLEEKIVPASSSTIGSK